MRVLLEARLGNARIPLQIDVGFGDVIMPAAEDREYPTLLTFPAPQLRTYSKESVVAEKFEAIVKLGIANSRMKDFYDLWVLAQRFRFESTTLAAAIEATFQTRRVLGRPRQPVSPAANSGVLSIGGCLLQGGYRRASRFGTGAGELTRGAVSALLVTAPT